MAEKKYTNGARYVGSVDSNGKRHGQGTYYYTTGAKWTGTWRNGDKHGYGTETSPDGSVRKGNWNCDVYVGEPTETPKTNTVKTTTNNKNKTSMKKSGILGTLGLELGKYTGDQLAFSPVGIAVKRKDGTFVVYDRTRKQIVEIGDLKMDVPFYLVPSLYAQLQVGDLIQIDGNFHIIEQKTENEGFKLQSPTTGSYTYKPGRTNLFGMYFYTKAVSLLDSVGGGLFGGAGAAAPAAGAAANPFGGGFNPMLLMLMNKDNGNSGGLDLTQLMLMSQFAGGGVGGLNPLLLMAMSGNGGDSDDLMQLLLMSQVSGAGVNPLASLFGTPAAPAAAPAAPAAPASNA